MYGFAFRQLEWPDHPSKRNDPAETEKVEEDKQEKD